MVSLLIALAVAAVAAVVVVLLAWPKTMCRHGFHAWREVERERVQVGEMNDYFGPEYVGEPVVAVVVSQRCRACGESKTTSE
jgi:hypothetical protein